ncbi:hypothetical protein C8R44DRAFT_734933 [Mycena epipterygia]|nr:hypothetical protein C8R44DRAFT_734933 [Mycena epipterygia]
MRERFLRSRPAFCIIPKAVTYRQWPTASTFALSPAYVEPENETAAEKRCKTEPRLGWPKSLPTDGGETKPWYVAPQFRTPVTQWTRRDHGKSQAYAKFILTERVKRRYRMHGAGSTPDLLVLPSASCREGMLSQDREGKITGIARISGVFHWPGPWYTLRSFRNSPNEFRSKYYRSHGIQIVVTNGTAFRRPLPTFTVNHFSDISMLGTAQVIGLGLVSSSEIVDQDIELICSGSGPGA